MNSVFVYRTNVSLFCDNFLNQIMQITVIIPDKCNQYTCISNKTKNIYYYTSIVKSLLIKYLIDRKLKFSL